MDWIERSRQGSHSGRVDRISALPDDPLLLLLARLGCAAAAARTSVLSRRWRGLWTHLRQIVFRDVAFPFLEAALGSVSPAVSLLEIRVPVLADPFPRRRVPEEHWPLLESSGIGSLLRAAARTVPEEFVLALPPGSISCVIGVDLPCFHRATSIVLDSAVFLNVPDGVMFPVLEKLSLLGCVVDLDALLCRCPHLRMLPLRLSGCRSHGEHLKVHSASLQQLVVNTGGSWVERFDIVAPSLKQLTMYLISSEMVGISILAPMVAKVSWWYVEGGIGFGVWRLKQMRLQATERQGELSWLHIHVSKSSAIFYGEEDGFTREIDKYMITHFSSLELHLITKGHIFGALVVHLLGTNRICSAMQRLKIVLQKSTRKERCPTDCPCKPTNCRSQTISLIALEEVEINGFEGSEPEIDFLKMIFKCAPVLKRMIVKLSHEASASNAGCTQIYNISKAYPSVEFCDLP